MLKNRSLVNLVCKAYGITQKQFSEHTGYSYNTMRKFSRDESLLSTPAKNHFLLYLKFAEFSDTLPDLTKVKKPRLPIKKKSVKP